MKIVDKDELIKKSSETLNSIISSFEQLERMKTEELIGKAALVIVDMNNGFSIKGTLYSPRIEQLIPEVSRLAHIFAEAKNIPVIIVNENHTENAREFNAYPPHCITGTEEAQIISELEDISNKIIIGKNCTNAFVIEQFKDTIIELNKKGINKFIVIGDCTDICIYQAAVSVQTYFNNYNLDGQVIVPLNAVDTYDLEATNHDGDLMNIVFLYSMIGNGIKVVRDIL